MGIADVTKRDTVLDAIDEFEEMGQTAFLSAYGAGGGSQLSIDYVGRSFPALAVMNAAHRIARDQPLSGVELADEAAVAEQLRTLGFNLSGQTAPARTRTATSSRPRTGTRTPARTENRPAVRATVRAKSWALQPGESLTRSQISSAYGGSKFSDIEFSARTRSVLLFSDPSEHPEEFDGWDDENPDVYHFTAEGRRGDQKWSKSNEAVRDHAVAGQHLRLFEAAEQGWRPGGKQQRYLGEFALDPEAPWRIERAPDADGQDRHVIVFRLVRVPQEPV